MNRPESTSHGAPKPVLATRDVVAIIVGLVIGAGIFRLPSLVAGNSASELVFYGLWVAGGLISLVGALCYAELATAYPNAGGDYYFWGRYAKTSPGVVKLRKLGKAIRVAHP